MAALFKLALGAFGFPVEMQFRDAHGIPVDLSASTTRSWVMVRPDGTQLEKDGFLVGLGVDGKLFWRVEEGDISQVGPWKMTAYVQTPTFNSFSETYEFFVEPIPT